MDLPAKIGRYDMLGLLGQGGMGRVFLARDTVLGRQVAIKLLRDDLGLPPSLRAALFVRMRNEARAAAALSHPNMVTLHDMGEEPNLGLYLVFEYVYGPTLRDMIAEGPLDAGRVAVLARQLGDALTHAHAAGVIHRDVKPENVLLAATGAKLTDFGIARLPDSTLTGAGSVLGTPAYSAPEALSLAEFSHASDQFSLAATLYEALTGRRAFPGEDVLTVATRVATEEPVAILVSEGMDARMLPRVNAALSRGMSKSAQKRFASCRELGDALASSLMEMEKSDRRRPSLFGLEPVMAMLPSVSEITTTGRISLSIVTKKTRRVQNIIAALAVLVIVGLLVIGRRTVDPGVSLHDTASSFETSVAAPRPVPVVHKPKAEGTKPVPSQSLEAGVRLAVVSDAGALSMLVADAAPSTIDAAAP